MFHFTKMLKILAEPCSNYEQNGKSFNFDLSLKFVINHLSLDIKSIASDYINGDIKNVKPLFGGDINQAFLIAAENENYVIKVNSSSLYPKMFHSESEGLSLLNSTGANVPEVIKVFNKAGYQYILMKFIQKEPSGNDFWTNLGISLARIHLKSETAFGLKFDNFIGTIPQKNSLKENWSDFFIENRLKPLVKKSYDLQLLKNSHLGHFEELFKQFDQLIPKEKPSLLHGDFWSGNMICGPHQNPYFIDPAVYFGHREMDISMSFLFGGFDVNYLTSYREIYPLEPDWHARIDLHNLYPRLVHLVLFGSSYLPGIEKVIRKF